MNLTPLQLFVAAIVVGIGFYGYAYKRVVAFRKQGLSLHSMPQYHGSYVFLWVFLPVLFFLFLWLPIKSGVLTHTMNMALAETAVKQNHLMVANSVLNYVHGHSMSLPDAFLPIAERYMQAENTMNFWRMVIAFVLMAMGGLFALTRLRHDFRARNQVEKYIKFVMVLCAGIAILTTFGILFSLLFESFQFFNLIPPQDFFFNTKWDPQQALHEGQVVNESFGVLPLLSGTVLISLIALLVAVPIGLLSAIYLSEYASARVRGWAKPMLEILAGIPTVVYGFFAAITVAPMIRHIGEAIGIGVASQSALAAGLVMGIMIIPFISSLSDDVINAVPQSLREGSYGLGATKSETIKRVIFPAALPGIVSAVLLAASRAIGETMIVVMAAGLSAKMTFNPLEAVTTMTVQIVTVLTGDTEFDSAKTLSAFALGLTLFVITFVLNIYALHVVKKYREQYD